MLRLSNELHRLTMKSTDIGHRECEFESLPDEIVFHIFSYLDIYDILNAALVCQKLLRVARDTTFMKEIVISSDIEGNSTIWGLKVEREGIIDILSRATLLKNLKIHTSYNSTLLQPAIQYSGSKLEQLELIDFNLTDESALLLEKNCTNLKSLIICDRRCWNWNASGNPINNLTKIRSLETLVLRSVLCVLPKHIIDIAQNCVFLQKIALLNITSINDESVDTLLRLRKDTLKVLILDGYYLTDNAFSSLSNCVKLEEFDIMDTAQLGSHVLKEISKLTKLEKLYYQNNRLLTKNNFTAAFNSNNLSSLSFIDLSGCINLDDDGLISIARVCQDLRELRVNGCNNLTDDGIIFMISQCKHLCSLSCENVGLLTEKVLDNIAFKLPKLEFLHLFHCPNIPHFLRNLGPIEFDSIRRPENYKYCDYDYMKYFRRKSIIYDH